MRLAGRPLRFLLAVSVGWVGVRVFMLWPVSSAGPLLSAPPLPERPAAVPGRRYAIAAKPFAPVRDGWAPQVGGHRPAAVRGPQGIEVAVLGQTGLRAPLARQEAEVGPLTAPGTRPQQLAASPRRWWGSAWLLVRGGSVVPQAGLTGGMLGGSQAGVRIGYAIDRGHRLSLYGRVSGALSIREREAALGVDWQPTALPLHLLAEQRLPLDGGQGGPTLGVVGGLGPVRLPGDFRLEAYGQGGVILRDGGIGFADGAARLQHRIAHAGPADIALGAGAWGGAQPGASRVDIGPSIMVDMPVQSRHLRLTLDWRQRIAGDARPVSGLALTLGADF